METNQLIDHDLNDHFELTESAKEFLKETAGWAQFLAILGFISVGFMVIFGIFFATFLNMMPMPAEVPFPTSIFSSIYIVFALIYFFPVLYLYQFSVKMKRALKEGDSLQLESSFRNLKAHYQFIGIIAIIIIGFYVLGFIVSLFIGFAGLMAF